MRIDWKKNGGQEILRGIPCEHRWKKDPRRESLARDLSRSTLHTVSPLGTGASGGDFSPDRVSETVSTLIPRTRKKGTQTRMRHQPQDTPRLEHSRAVCSAQHATRHPRVPVNVRRSRICLRFQVQQGSQDFCPRVVKGAFLKLFF